MPEFRIGVLALSPGDENEFSPGQASAQFSSLIAQGFFNLNQAGQPYAASPDDWVPFDDGKSILEHVKAGLEGFTVIADSRDLSSVRTRRGIQLFALDAAVLLHPRKAQMASLIQENVCARSDCGACIIIPKSIPNPFRDTLLGLSRVQLSDLHAYRKLVEVPVDEPERLETFLARLPALFGLPIKERALEALAMFQGWGVPLVGAVPPPDLARART